MKIQRLVMLHIAVLLVLTGCMLPKQYPIENIQNILVAGVDIEDGQIKLTVLADKIISGGQAGNEKIVTQIYSGKGATVSEAENMIKAHLLYIPTVQVIPTAQKENAKGSEGGGQEAEYLMELGGFALFKNNMLAGYLVERQAMGLNIAINKLKNAIITMTDRNGKRTEYIFTVH